jgi:predicted nuclease of predicted toxin-antitoxin system
MPRHSFSTSFFFLFLCCSLAIILSGCGGGSLNLGGGGSGSGNALPTPDHVVIVVLENHSFSQVIGSPAMPYFNSLANAHSLATNYFGNVHPSIGNYLMLTTGQIETIDDNFTGTISDDNVERALIGAGKSWRAYMESIPSAAYLGPNVGFYLRHHDPFAYFSDNVDPTGKPTAQAANIVPFTQLQADLAANTVPNYLFIAPNSVNDAHDCPGGASTCADTAKLATADTWLKNNIDPLINNPAFANSVFIITFDEGDFTDLSNVGGQVATVLVGTHVKAGFKSTTMYQHQNTLRLVLDLLKVGDRPGASSVAGSMNEFFQ